MFRNPSTWKLVLASMAFGLALRLTLMDIGEPISTELRQLTSTGWTPATMTYGVKAALLAMIAVSVLFISVVPIGATRGDRQINLYVGVVGAFASGLACWFWLLSVTGGILVAYQGIILSAMALSMLILILALLLRYGYEEDEGRIKETGEAKLNWRVIATGVIWVTGHHGGWWRCDPLVGMALMTILSPFAFRVLLLAA